MKITAYIVYGVSQALYKLFGVNTPSRKAWLKQEARKLQNELDRQHNIKKIVNERLNEVYTTKKAMKLDKELNWL